MGHRVELTNLGFWRRRSRPRRAAGVTLGVLASAALLAGCGEYSDQSALDLTISEGRFAVVNCGNEEVAPPVRFLLTVRQPGEEWEDAFEASGNVAFVNGSQFTNDPDGWTEVDTDQIRELEPGAKVEVSLTSGGRTSATYTVPAEGLGEGEWLSYRGGVASAPCSD